MPFPPVSPAAGLSNQLKQHSSPYLALHGSDPVAWQDWSQQAVDIARQEEKLLYLSIGYFSCHWCHVMQRESYKNKEIAAFLNRHFVPVKVDRELEPALDARMIAFTEATRGLSGWPLNVFITPEGHPLYAVLYMPAGDFLAVLKQLQGLWQRDKTTLKKLAYNAVAGGRGPGEPQLDKKRIQSYVDKMVNDSLRLGDPVHGGFGDQSKFPSVPQLDFLLSYLAATPNKKLSDFIILTLDQMADYGLHDHLGGGFFRYTVDPAWQKPHFEKMLYDNALLTGIYLKAWRQFERDDYRKIAERTLDFMAQSMRASSGALIASLSALDKNGVEGGFYLWSPDQLSAVLNTAERKVYRYAWAMEDAAPFEAGYLPMKGKSIAEIAREIQAFPHEVKKLLHRAENKLRKARARRKLPEDTKLLAGWNGLALSAYANAARLIKARRYLETAQGIRDYIAHNLWDGKTLKRSVHAGESVGKVSLEDYSYVAQGLLDWAELTGERSDYQLVAQILGRAWQVFYSKRGWRLAEESFIETEAGEDIVLDGPMPSPSAVLLRVSIELAGKTRDAGLRKRSLGALNTGHKQLSENPFWTASHIGAMLQAR